MTGLEVLAEGAFLGTAARHEIDKEKKKNNPEEESVSVEKTANALTEMMRIQRVVEELSLMSSLDVMGDLLQLFSRQEEYYNQFHL
jgi:hypothetical protein